MIINAVNCEWSDYSWGECDKSCGGGTQTGERHYAQLAENGGQECTGETTTTQSCNEQECPGKCIFSHCQGTSQDRKLTFAAKIDCAWSAYSWGECDKTCGGGYQYGERTVARYADGGKECEGEAASTRSCNTDPCPGNIHIKSVQSCCLPKRLLKNREKDSCNLQFHKFLVPRKWEKFR